ncbi:hypothetical protein IU500_34390 [Nocardia terpenica]|uniref:hypothetical protein n=1 Tax=Nocardia terpenica TaxID=455432 RepID=UPI001895A78D|nr:hypothetical protein [Nocardia terpenica]MBF6065424.1 hypothetical protein [Nocardia terpenica]MBF6109106.1 hypothetical protein [Nocardia terpenica]MBF6114692.1 hypothetical protein [Nocardia terpenica]MBF6123377.1 hypothetical protein [Nocardia terpenica]MBF6156605.1 hypothetical protein [Nocardia terpenica]
MLADDARARIEQLQAAGMLRTQMAQLAGLTHSTIGRIVGGQDRISADVEAAILAVGVPERVADVTAANALVPIHGARRRMQALVAFGYPRRELAAQLGIPTNSGQMTVLMGLQRRGERFGLTITAEREREIKALFDRLQFTPGPSERARARGRRKGWALPFEWDEDSIDDPRGRPVRARWTPRSSSEERRAQVTELTERGLSARQIARRLHTTDRTVTRDRTRTATDAVAGQGVSEVEAMGAVAVQARRDLSARHASTAAARPPVRRERTR